MDFLTIFLGFLFSYTTILALLSLSRIGKPKNLPPGPTRLPIIGNLHLLGEQPHQSLAKLAKIHGPIMFLNFGRLTTLVISSAAAAKEVLQKQDLAFSSRHVSDALRAHNHFQYSVVFLPVSNRWRTLRKILNSYIFSSNCLDANQQLRCHKVQELVAYCQKSSQRGEAVNMGQAAFRTSLNLLSNTMFSSDLTEPYQDSGAEFKELVVNITLEAGKPNCVDFFPVLRKIDPQGNRRRMTQNFKKIFEVFNGLIDKRLEMRKSAKTGGNNDVLDACLNISQQNPEDIDRTHIEHMFLDLFVAGTDTTSSTLEWAMAEVLRNPHTMAKAKEELGKVVGKGKILEEADVSRLPYLRCIVKETLRIHPPVPFLIPRKVETNVQIERYTVPKGTQVLVNAWAIGRDSTLWGDALEFRPERFWTSEVEARRHDFEWIPFGAGRRICPGLPLAMRMLPLMLGSLLNNFDWKLDGGIGPKELDMTEKFGITLQKAVPLHALPMLLT